MSCLLAQTCSKNAIKLINNRGTGTSFNFDFDGLMTLAIEYHLSSMLSFKHSLQSHCLSRKVLDGMRQSLRSLDRPSSFRSMQDIVVHVLALIEEALVQLQLHQQNVAVMHKRQLFIESDETPEIYGPDLDVESIHDTISSLIGLKPKAFLESIGDILRSYQGSSFEISRIVHCEVVMRNDLSRRFMQKRQNMQTKLRKYDVGQLRKSVPAGAVRRVGSDAQFKEDLIMHLTTPKLTFHGTTSSVVASIVQYGFLKPGDRHPKTGTSLPVRCGSTYGRGIYSSPSAAFSLMYSGMDAAETKPSEIPGKKLLICATLMGRSASMNYHDNWRDQSAPYPGSDSHVANNQHEYIVFDSAQILPCYVVHLDWGKDTAAVLDALRWDAHNSSVPVSRLDRRTALSAMSPGDKQRAKAERLAQGQKFFAYGFGPVAGNRLVIEDVAEVDDDEENYGDYQANRLEMEETQHATSVWDWGDLEGETLMDQYSSQRKAAREKKRWEVRRDMDYDSD